MDKRIFCGILTIALFIGANAQTSLNSPYSQYGVGVLADQSQGFSRGMNGASLGVRKGDIVNTLNPASYACVDSLTMIFDMGISAQNVHFKETVNGVSQSLNAKNASVDYVVGSFRLFPRIGMAFGLLPLSNVGYKYTSSTYLDNTNGSVTETYEGSGGLHQVFLGAGWQATKSLSVGANISYVWGVLNRKVTSSSTTYVNSLSRVYDTNINSYKIELGAQWQQPLDKDNQLTLGATVGIGHKLGADAQCMVINVSNADSTIYTVKDAFALPMTYGVGAAWTYKRNLVVDADFCMQAWGNIDYPDVDGSGKYVLQSNLLKNRYQVKLGADYVPNPIGRKLYQRVHYRFGGGYTTPYYKINGGDGPKEWSLTAGFGIPLQNSYNNRSVLNVSAQLVNTAATDKISERAFRINIGLTFNERWFAKWKVN